MRNIKARNPGGLISIEVWYIKVKKRSKPPSWEEIVEERMMKCQHCGYEGPVESFRYLYNLRLDDNDAWRECPKCFGWNLYNAMTSNVDSWDDLGMSYPIHSDEGVAKAASGKPIDLGLPEEETCALPSHRKRIPRD
jgi:hypothetical protein